MISSISFGQIDQEPGGGLSDPNPAACTNLMPWTNFFPNGIPQNQDWITLCPEFTRVNLGAGTGAKLTVGKGYLTGDQIDELKLLWTDNYQFFKSVELQNNTVLKWANPGFLGFDGENNPIFGWSHGIVQDEEYGLRFLRSQQDDNSEVGYSSLGIQNSGDVEVMGANFMLGGGKTAAHKRWSFQTQHWDQNSNDLFIHPELGINSNTWDGSNFFVLGANGDFHVKGGDAYICGTVKATEVIVETGWCDYVFEADYQLMSLGELREFIKLNKHLPKVPKAEVVESEGMKVGEMNMIMMEKIEEMYLYILQLESRINELED
ncbi:MAG: hypothetical protein ACI9GM_000423 [Salibacteraceae bacterium]